MTKRLMTILATTFLTTNIGCYSVSANNTRFGLSSAVVAVNGRVYIVDTRRGTAREVDLTQAKVTDPADTTTDPKQE